MGLQALHGGPLRFLLFILPPECSLMLLCPQILEDLHVFLHCPRIVKTQFRAKMSVPTLPHFERTLKRIQDLTKCMMELAAILRELDVIYQAEMNGSKQSHSTTRSVWRRVKAWQSSVRWRSRHFKFRGQTLDAGLYFLHRACTHIQALARGYIVRTRARRRIASR